MTRIPRSALGVMCAGLLGASGMPQSQETTQPPAQLEDVEVTARREALRTALTGFVSRLAPADSTAAARWREPVCVWVGGVTALADAPSILRLFAVDAREAPPAGLTDWDRAFLNAVYGLRDTYQRERSVIVTRMLQQLESPD